MLRKKVIGSKKKQLDTLKQNFKSSEQGAVKDAIQEMAKDPDHPIKLYGGGQRENVHIASGRADEAIEYIENTDEIDLPWGWD